MLRSGLIALGIGAMAALLIVTNVVKLGPCADLPAALCVFIILICMPVGFLLLIAAGARAFWLKRRLVTARLQVR
jgi:hypothetical protein